MTSMPCRCGHGREWHDSCSKCYCPFYLPKGQGDRGQVALWRAGYEARKAREAR